MKQKICICGGGALGHVISGVLSTFEDCEVYVYTRHPEKWSNTLTIIAPENKTFIGTIARISNRPEDTVAQCEIVLLCLPGFAIENTLKQIQPHITNQKIGSVVCSSGFFFVAHKIFDNHTSLFGFQRVPFISRVIEYGKTANLLGYRSRLFIACENIKLPETFAAFWEKHLFTPVSLLDNYLEASLTNSNPLLHPSRLYGLWHDWHEGIAYDHCPFFYKEWDEFSADIYIKCDQEFQKLTQVLGIHIQDVLSYYESTDPISLAKKFNSIDSLSTIMSPMIRTEKGWIPDFKNRYFTEDFPYGMQVIKDTAEKYQISTPTIDKVLAWGKQFI